jgi:predicted nucleotidyltransferase
MTIEELRKSGWIGYEYMRGSHMYHLNIETSDIDVGGVFICPKEMLLGLRSNYQEQIADEKNDTVFYEFGRWIELLMKANPTALESLFAPKDCIIGEVNPAIQHIIDNRDMFVSKECFKTFYGYAVSQIGKARGLNKKIVNPISERKDILDFCYTIKNQGSQPIKDFLEANNLDQKYCGLVNVPNMRDVYGVYYDFAAYFKFEVFDKSNWWTLNPDEENDKVLLTEESFQNWCFDMRYRTVAYDKFMDYDYAVKTYNRVINKEFFGYSGIVHPDEIEKSNEVRLSSIPKGEMPICNMSYNKDAYTCHCRDYKDYKEWEAKRNPVRYESNLNKNYDSKNVMHCMRLVRMAKELAQGKGFNVVRDEDRQYLLDIRNHKFEYDEVMEQLEKEKREMEIAIEQSTLPEHSDYNKINQLLIEARNKFYNIY